MLSGGFELTKLTCTRLEDNLICLMGDWSWIWIGDSPCNCSVAIRVNRVMLVSPCYKIQIQSSCEIEYFVETHVCKLCVIFQSRVLRVVCPH